MSGRKKLASAVGVALVGLGVGMPRAALGTVYTWNGGGADSNWSTQGNWGGSGPPISGDTATFSNSLAGANNKAIVTIGSVNAQIINYTGATAAAYTLGTSVGSGTITLDDGNSTNITMASNLVTSQVINSNIILGTAAAGSLSFTNNNTTQSLTIAGNVTGGTSGTPGIKALALNGTGTVVNTISGNISPGNLTALNVSFAGGGGTWVLSGTDSFIGNSPSVNNTGNALVVNGSFTTSNGLNVNNGKFGGTGSVIVNAGAGNVQVDNNSIVAPGDFTRPAAASTGVLSITGKLTFTPAHANSLQIALGGNQPGNGQGFYSQANVSGNVTVGSLTTLGISLVNGYTPATTDVFYVASEAGNNSTFPAFSNLAEGANVAALGAGWVITYKANWGGTQGSSTLTGGNDIAIYNPSPEPASLGLFAIGGLGLLLRRRQRN